MGGGDLDQRVTFLRRGKDAYGRATEEPAASFTVWARIRYLIGGETVMQARLEKRQPVVFTIRDSRQAREIGEDWGAEHARLGMAFSLTGCAPAKEPGFIDILGECSGPIPG